VRWRGNGGRAVGTEVGKGRYGCGEANSSQKVREAEGGKYKREGLVRGKGVQEFIFGERKRRKGKGRGKAEGGKHTHEPARIG